MVFLSIPRELLLQRPHGLHTLAEVGGGHNGGEDLEGEDGQQRCKDTGKRSVMGVDSGRMVSVLRGTPPALSAHRERY